MKKMMMVVLLVIGMAGCSVNPDLPEGTDNVPPSPNWERIANVSYKAGVYKVVDTEDSVICYYLIAVDGRSGISCMAYYHEGSRENQRQVE